MFSFYHPRNSCCVRWSRAVRANHCKLGGLKQYKFTLACSGDQKSKVKVSTGPRSLQWLPPCSLQLLLAQASVGLWQHRSSLCLQVAFFVRQRVSVSALLLRTFVIGFKLQLVNAEDDLISRSFTQLCL